MVVALKISIPKNTIKNLGNASESSMKEVQKVIAGWTIQTRDDAKRLIKNTPKTGRVYRRSGGKTHIASSPGNPPATDTGDLVSDIFHEIHFGGLGGEIGTSLDYGLMLEDGTKKMEPRPFLTPALENNQDDIVNDIVEALKDHLV